MKKSGKDLRTKQASPPENEIDDLNNTSSHNYKKVSKWFSWETNENDTRSKNKKDCQCIFQCVNCRTLGGDLVKSRYEITCIINENDKAIFWPMWE